MSLAIFILLSVFLLQSVTLAQTGRIKGVITEKESGNSLTGANVMVKGTTLGAATNFDGN
ncbi:MAG: carboxypeptidase-like regulatory domain-containing protein [Melioribacteraceae bacterium]|nr:carboxypeptidase-like regulatory domain-containing protein [Melioribacteraceae bacterium]